MSDSNNNHDNSGDEDSGHNLLHELAEAAGLAVHWKNYRNEDQVVSADTLCKILEALGIEADTEEQCRESIARLRQEAAEHCPPLLITRSNRRLELPQALQRDLQGETALGASDEHGSPLQIALETDGAGKVHLVPPMEPGYYLLQLGKGRQPGHRELWLAVAPPSCTSVPELTGTDAAWGIGVQLYSLRRHGDGGVGDFTALRDFSVSMAGSGASAIAVSPVHSLFSADRSRFSPYAPSSRLFLNVLHIDPEQTFSADLVQSCLRKAELVEAQQELEQRELIDWPEAARVKLTLLRCIWEESQAELLDESHELGAAFADFRSEGGDLLELHATFEALHAYHFNRDPNTWHWRHWEPQYRDHNSEAVSQFAAEHRHEVLFHSFLQWLADRGLAEAHAACREAGAGIGLISDLAVGTDSGGSHAWSRKEDMLTGLSVGAPPDMLNRKGQDWGLTSFSPRALAAHGYAPMLEMLRASLRHAGGLRIDHILGLRRLWVIPEGASPQEGAYLQFPQDDLLSLIALESWRHRAVIVGEDLGTIPGNFRQHLAETGLLGIGVLWFEKDGGLFIDPSRWRPNVLATTTTHDLPTVTGWWRCRDVDWDEKLHRLPADHSREQMEEEREQDRNALWAAFQHAGLTDEEKPSKEDAEPVVDVAVAFVAKTPSPLALIPVEDLLGIEEQPNLPGTIDEHPNWRRRLPVTSTQVVEQDLVQRRMATIKEQRQQKYRR
ncbi:4-alpha-glucanotransferase [Proteobacteria bacterium 005FR1]|nr:4-alpha-glucanotransferase [Proteobacteria bacterium 005FR1]